MNHPSIHLVAASFLNSPGRGARKELQTRDNTFREAGHQPGRASGTRERASLLGGHFHRVGPLGFRTSACAFMPVAECFTS